MHKLFTIIPNIGLQAEIFSQNGGRKQNDGGAAPQGDFAPSSQGGMAGDASSASVRNSVEEKVSIVK